jgi:hypothetical protein
LHQYPGNIQVMQSGNCHRSRIHLVMGADELVNRAEAAAAEFRSYRIGLARVRVNHSYQTNRFALLAELVIHAGVISPESSSAYDRNIDDARGFQFELLFRQKFLRQGLV